MLEKCGISPATHAATNGGLNCENFMHLGPFENWSFVPWQLIENTLSGWSYRWHLAKLHLCYVGQQEDALLSGHRIQALCVVWPLSPFCVPVWAQAPKALRSFYASLLQLAAWCCQKIASVCVPISAPFCLLGCQRDAVARRFLVMFDIVCLCAFSCVWLSVYSYHTVILFCWGASLGNAIFVADSHRAVNRQGLAFNDCIWYSAGSLKMISKQFGREALNRCMSVFGKQSKLCH